MRCLDLGKLHPIPPGYYCVPSALAAITGEDPLSVIVPAISRHRKDSSLLEAHVGVEMDVAKAVLEELGYECRRSIGKTRQVRTWARMFPNEVILIAAERHCMILHKGRVFDTWTPHGEAANAHPFSTARVWSATLVRRKT